MLCCGVCYSMGWCGGCVVMWWAVLCYCVVGWGWCILMVCVVMSCVCIHLYDTFWIISIAVDLLLKSELLLF